MNPRTRRITEPDVAGISLDEIKARLRVTHDLEDDLLRAYGFAATRLFEARTHQTVIETTFEHDQESWSDPICLQESPHLSLESITYYDEDDAEQTLDLANVQVITSKNIPATLCRINGYTWPDLSPGRADAVKIRYTAGMATGPAGVPEIVKVAIGLVVALFDEQRSPIITGTIVSQVPIAFDSIVNHFKTGYYAQ